MSSFIRISTAIKSPLTYYLPINFSTTVLSIFVLSLFFVVLLLSYFPSLISKYSDILFCLVLHLKHTESISLIHTIYVISFFHSLKKESITCGCCISSPPHSTSYSFIHQICQSFHKYLYSLLIVVTINTSTLFQLLKF